MLPSLTFVLGGASSGKTGFAEGQVLDHVRRYGGSAVYLATAQVFDDEMHDKVTAHRACRRDQWQTIESPFDAARVLLEQSPSDVVLLDCATLWLTNMVLTERDVEAETRILLAALNDTAARVVTVSNEVGHGIVPEHKLGRQFRDAQGKLNQRLAAAADLAVLIVAGLPITLKGALPCSA